MRQRSLHQCGISNVQRNGRLQVRRIENQVRDIVRALRDSMLKAQECAEQLKAELKE